MLVLITGGSGSGKSAYAEDVTCELSENKNKYYLATMQVYGEEGKRKVQRHIEAREGKNFITIEQQTDIHNAKAGIKNKKSTLLLECMSNLVANEMFTPEGIKAENEVIQKVASDINRLYAAVENLVIVTNNVFEDGIQYDDTTMAYNRALGRINTELAKSADMVTEVVVGIPVVIKKPKN